MISVEEATSHAVVIGATGKMGRGISLLLLRCLPGGVTLIDQPGSDFSGLERYLGKELLSRATISDSLEAARGAKLVFESIVEDVEAKCALFASLREIVDPSALFLSNTSSIPISELERGSALRGRIIGFHFFNPPPVQRLVELIAPPSLRRFGLELASRLNKVVIQSADVAGFISNGYFLREVRYACGELEELGLGGVALLDQITERLLVRPMGIFRLIDYVGLDVCSHIGQVMHRFSPGSDFSIPMIEEMIQRGRSGFFSYDGERPTAVYNFAADCYDPLPPPLDAPFDPPQWRSIKGEEECEAILADHFTRLFALKGRVASIAQDYLLESREIVQQLVRDGVAEGEEVVDDLLQWGFGHLYSPGIVTT